MITLIKYISMRLDRITPNFPIEKVKTLSSMLEKPNIELLLTSLRQRPHLWIAYLVSDTRNGKSINDKMPNIIIAIMVNRYPIKVGRYSTIDCDTASQ